MKDLPEGRPDVVFRPVGREWVAFDPTANLMHVMNVTSALIWQQCDGGTSVSQIAQVLSETLEEAPDAVALEQHVEDTISTFVEQGLLL